MRGDRCDSGSLSLSGMREVYGWARLAVNVGSGVGIWDDGSCRLALARGEGLRAWLSCRVCDDGLPAPLAASLAEGFMVS